jgi:hypothetical protein
MNRIRKQATFSCLVDLPALSIDEAPSINSKIYSLKRFWIKRYGEGFYTLGRATYLDYCLPRGSIEPAKNPLAHFNEILEPHFQALYERIILLLQELLRCKVNLTNLYAIPGFHLFFGYRINSAAAAEYFFAVLFTSRL